MNTDQTSNNVAAYTISFIGNVLAFLLALQWQTFITDSITDTAGAIRANHEAKHKPLPKSVSSLISTIIITAIAVAALIGLYIWSVESNDPTPFSATDSASGETDVKAK